MRPLPGRTSTVPERRSNGGGGGGVEEDEEEESGIDDAEAATPMPPLLLLLDTHPAAATSSSSSAKRASSAGARVEKPLRLPLVRGGGISGEARLLSRLSFRASSPRERKEERRKIKSNLFSLALLTYFISLEKTKAKILFPPITNVCRAAPGRFRAPVRRSAALFARAGEFVEYNEHEKQSPVLENGT